MAKENRNPLKQYRSTLENSFDNELDTLDSILNQNFDAPTTHRSTAPTSKSSQEVPILSDIIDSPDMMDMVFEDTHDVNSLNNAGSRSHSNQLSDEVMSRIAMGGDEAKKLAMQAMDKMHRISPNATTEQPSARAVQEALAERARLMKAQQQKQAAATPPRTQQQQPPASEPVRSSMPHEDEDQYNYKLQALTREVRENAETILQDVLDEFVPHIEAELHKRLNQKIDTFIAQAVKVKTQQR